MLVIGCGALARELLDIVEVNRLNWIDVKCLPAILHNSPSDIPAAVAASIDAATGYDNIFVGYADCGTGGALDRVLDERGIERLPGSHCYEFFSTTPEFSQLHEAEPGTFYLTDYLARHFDRLVWQGLGLDRYPGLLDNYFGNYSQLVYLSQRREPALVRYAEAAAVRLGLRFEHRSTGYGDLQTSLLNIRLKVG
jgi:hypothetical protein